VPLRVSDRQLLASLLPAVLGDISLREGIAVLAPVGAEELEGSAPPRALPLGATVIGARGWNV
jgi:hypothetical protein